MIVLFIVLPLALLLAGGALLAFIWSIREGQLDDLSTSSIRLLSDENELKVPIPVKFIPEKILHRQSEEVR